MPLRSVATLDGDPAGTGAPRHTATFTIISAHFGDMFWIRQLLTRTLPLYGPDGVVSVRVIDQSRDNAVRLSLGKLPGNPEVVSFPEDRLQIALLGHDHPASLDRAIALPTSTTHVIILDSDCFPISDTWLARIRELLATNDAIVARDPAKHGLSHPCLMVIPSSSLMGISFSEGLLEAGIDTGRLVGLRLRRLGLSVYWDAPTAGFRGRRGHLYLDGTIYHHGSASFISSTQSILRNKVNVRVERYFRSKIERNDFSLRLGDRLFLRFLKMLTTWNSYATRK